MDKQEVVHKHNEILLGHKKREVLPLVTTRMDLEGIMLSEISLSSYYLYLLQPLYLHGQQTPISHSAVLYGYACDEFEMIYVDFSFA